MKMTTAIILIVLVVIVGALAYGTSRYQGDKIRQAVAEERRQIEASKNAEIETLKAENLTLQKALELSRARYGRLKGMIAEASKKDEAIQPPKTDAETRDRFTRLGYPPK